MGGLSDLLNSHIIERWWGTINKRSKAEVDFKRSITDKNRIPSTRIQAKLFKASSPNIGICQTPKELLYHPWVESIDPSPEAKQSDLCIVLEDMSLEWVEILGPLLSIPVSVFALHWANPIDHVGGDIRVPIGESPARHFILNYRQSLPFSILERSNDQNLEYRLDCNVVRPITSRSKDYEGIETSDQLVSFYATGLTRSGPSILLVDPVLTSPSSAIRVVFSDSRDEKLGGKYAKCIRQDCPAPSLLSNSEEIIRIIQQRRVFIPESEFTNIESVSSIFDELNTVVKPGINYGRTSLLSLASSVRRLVLARNGTAMNALLQETVQLTANASIGVTNIADFNFATFEERAWVDEWRGAFFRQLWTLREELEFQGYKLQQNLGVVRRVARILQNDGEAKSPPVKDNDAPSVPGNDLWEWEELEKLRLYAFKIMERTTDSYLQTVQATGAQFANIQTKSVGRLTGLVGLFVPASLCAAVLAIPNFGGHNENQKFWIFWAVSVPIAIILMVFFFTPWPRNKIRRWKAWYQKRHRKAPLPAYMQRPFVNAKKPIVPWPAYRQRSVVVVKAKERV